MLNFEKKLVDVFKQYGVTSENELACVLGNASHETGGFRKFEESGKYRFAGALKTFTSKVYQVAIKAKQAELKAQPTDFVPQPWFFNLVYGSRLGNEDNGVQDNDGFDFRGGGAFHLTGKGHYENCYDWLAEKNIINKAELSFDKFDEYVKTEDGAVYSALYFWMTTPKLRPAAQALNIDAVTKIINGGTNGAKERQALVTSYLKVLA